MDFKFWVNQQLDLLKNQLVDAKQTLKQAKAEKKKLEKEEADFSHINIQRFGIAVENINGQIDDFKKVQKLEIVRLQTGKIISLSTLKAFNKKISSRMWTTAITQHPDGLKLVYTDGSAKGQLTITGFGVDMTVPDEVKLPIYTEGEVLECLIHS